jgi:hypothetical protein
MKDMLKGRRVHADVRFRVGIQRVTLILNF